MSSLVYLQVLLTEFRSLPPLFEETPNAVHELTIASKNSWLQWGFCFFGSSFYPIPISNEGVFSLWNYDPWIKETVRAQT